MVYEVETYRLAIASPSTPLRVTHAQQKKWCSLFYLLGKSLLLCLFFSFHTISAQNTKQFHDAYGLQGEVNFNGEWSDTLLPRNGNLEIKWRELNNSLMKTYFAKGKLINHLPEGRWQWDEADWQYTIEPGVTIAPKFNSSGKRASWEARFANGQPQGEWILNIDSVRNVLKIEKPGLSIRATFDNGQITGRFTVTDKRDGSFSLTGMCDRDGFATGKWTCSYLDGHTRKPVTEERTYQQGLLTEIIITKNGKKETTSLDLTKAQLAALSEATEMLHFRIGDYAFDEDGYPGISQTALQHYLHNYFFKGFQLEVFPYAFSRHGPVFRKIEYPLSQEEKVAVHRADSLMRHMKREIEQRLQYRNIIINRGWSGELDLALAFSKTAITKFELADSLLQRTQHPLFAYKNRYEIGNQQWFDLINEQKIVQGAVYDTHFVDLPIPERDAISHDIFKTIYDWILNFNTTLPQHLEIIDDAYDALQKVGELQTLEDRITQKMELLDSIYQPLSGLGEYIREQWVENYFKDQLQTYSQTTQYEDAKNLGWDIIEKMRLLIQRVDEWQVYDAMLKAWDEQYTHFAYNPYNGKHDIQIRIKKRFYNKAGVDLHPWLIRQFYEIESWTDFIAHWNLSNQLHHDMLAFALMENRSAKRFEKRFRKEDNPERLAKMLHQYIKNH